MNNQAGGGNKLPRIGNKKKPSRQSTMHSLISPPGCTNVVEEKRRFVTVVRPLSVFPEPALPPHYTPSVFSTSSSGNNGTGSYNNRYDDFSHMIQQHNPVIQRGRPPSPVPFPQQQQQQRHQQRSNQRSNNSNFSLAGQGVGNGYQHGGGPGSAALRVNLAGGSGWDLTAIKRGYNNVGYNASSYKSM
jgi:hypothetical protein